MKALKLPFIRFIPFLLPVLLVLSCVPAATTLHNSGNFSNLRSEIMLTDGSILRGYASLNALKGEQAIRVRVPGEREERAIPLSKIDRLLADEHEFVVKWLQTPNHATFRYKSGKIRAMVKRIGMEADPVQVFEYKYAVSNPKSPISNTLTAWFVSFPDDPEDLPLCELNSSCYKRKWAKLLTRNENNSVVSSRAPSSAKSLIEQVKKLELSQDPGGLQNFGAAE